MNSHKYSRLPTSDPGPDFSALDGPSYYSYEIERKKYGSAFSYSGAPGPAEHSQPLGKIWPMSHFRGSAGKSSDLCLHVMSDCCIEMHVWVFFGSRFRYVQCSMFGSLVVSRVISHDIL